ncbi:NADPH-dependent aldehyde reductase ARI1 [Escovopsis weberi]|uniref:NADPH-dependent aldehyde reductase ARI1 n=1 Tax=Escovopsis weberi TaxID=150374 RepID=A0A0M8N3P7_ESCWE|nr:NADPH-dependent aldehyde reductase ARI1 [Escovopsis weberi]
MGKILVTGGSGFMAGHIIQRLLAAGHVVFTTVRSEDKAAQVRTTHAAHPSLRVLLSGDFVRPDAFDSVLAQLAPERLDVVLHTASPFQFDWSDPQTQAVDAAVNGVKSIFAAVAAHAPSVRRVVMTSSFAVLTNENRVFDPTFVYDEQSWNAGTADINIFDGFAYLVSKVSAERAAWAFMEERKPSFDLVTVCQGTTFGPPLHHVTSLSELNFSGRWVAGLLRGEWKTEIPSTGPTTEWTDVRDAAEAHLRAMDLPPAPPGHRRRLLPITGRGCHHDMARFARDHFPELAHILPGPDVKGGEMPPEDQFCKFNNTETLKLLEGMQWTSLETCVVDTIKVLKHCVV